MAEIEYGGIKIGGSKLLLIVPLLGTIIGGLWGGFELYSRYLDMEEKIQTYVAPDLSGFDKRIELVQTEVDMIQKEMQMVLEEITLVADVAKEMVSMYLYDHRDQSNNPTQLDFLLIND